MLKKIHLTILAVCFTLTAFTQNTYYVDQQNGNDTNNGQSSGAAFKTFDKAMTQVSGGDTIKIMGEYHNGSYDPNYTYPNSGNAAQDAADSHLWHAENTIKINGFNGGGSYLTITSFDSNTIIKGDGANIVRIINSSYIKVDNLEIEGEVDRIPLAEANKLQFVYVLGSAITNPLAGDIKFRNEEDADGDHIVEETDTYPPLGNVTRPSYIDTRGIYVSGSDHIKLLNSKIHHTTGGGVRFSESKIVEISGNEVYRCSARSFSGTHGLVVTKAIDAPGQIYSIEVKNNNIHHNYNEQYSWSPSKTIITPRIDEGKGISLQRNNLTPWKNGSSRILVQNNIAYWNGFSGAHSNDGYRIDFINNTCFMNSYTNTVTYAGQTQQGNNIGISTGGTGDDVKMINNIVVIDTDWNGKALNASNGTTTLVVKNNLVYGFNDVTGKARLGGAVDAVDVNTINQQDPLLVDAPTAYQNETYVFDFNLQNTSPAIDAADAADAPPTDYAGNTRTTPDIGAYEYVTASITITSMINGDWNVGATWVGGVVPTAANNVVIAHTVKVKITTAECNNLTVNTGKTLQINSGKALTIKGNLIADGTVKFATTNSNNKQASLIVNGTVSGTDMDNMVYNNHLPSSNWHLVSSPFKAQRVATKVVSLSDAFVTNATHTAMATYDDSQPAGSKWVYYANPVPNDNATKTTPGKGYSVQLNGAQKINFKGGLNTGDVTISIPANQYSLVGNPYTASIYGNDAADATNNVLRKNGSNGLNILFEDTLWYWNQATSSYEPHLLGDAALHIHPIQGFFVKANGTGGNFTFTTTMQHHDVPGGTTRTTSNRFEIHLSLTNDTANKTAQIRYADNTTTGFDNGYDGSVFGGVAYDFMVYTEAVANSQGRKLAIQSLPDADYESMVVPVGVKAAAGKEITFSAEVLNLPANYKVFIEDRETGTFTRIDESGTSYKVTPTTDLNGVGRFYVHTSTEKLKVEDVVLNSIKVLATNTNSLRIVGLPQGATSVQLFTVLGKKVVERSFTTTGTKELALPVLSKGIYLVKLQTAKGKTTKKIIL